MRSLAALKMLLHDRSTTAGAVLGVVAIVFLVGQQLSVLFGLFNYMTVLVDHSGADIWVCTQSIQNINGAGFMPVRYVDRISGLPVEMGGETPYTTPWLDDGTELTLTAPATEKSVVSDVSSTTVSGDGVIRVRSTTGGFPIGFPRGGGGFSTGGGGGFSGGGGGFGGGGASGSW